MSAGWAIEAPCSGSGMIQRNCVSPVNSSMEERAIGWRRSDLEKKMISAMIC
jgi:hypothetical protein